MRTFSKISKVVVLVCSLALVTTANAQWPQTTDHHVWSIEFGGLAYDRPGTDLEIPLIVDSNTLMPLFDAEQATDLGATAGAEIKLNFETRRGSEFEVRSVLAFWRTQIDEILGPNLDSPFFMDGIVPDTFNYAYESDYWSIEVMKKKAIKPGIIGFLGPRVVSTKDNVFYRSTLAVDPGDGTPDVTVVADTDVTATNILIGAQTGLEVNQPVTYNFHFNGFVRVGAYLNPTQVTATEADTINGSVTHQLTKNTGSFLGEIGGRGYYYFVPNRAAVYVGYEATWIDGLAIAPTQLLFTGIDPSIANPTVETANTIFFQAITFGLNFAY